MATARLIGRLGGPPEVVETAIAGISSGSHSVTLPAGWGSAWCVFQGTVDGSARQNVTIFGRTTHGDQYLYRNTPVGGGVLLQAGQSTTIGSRLEGTLTQIRMS